MHPTSIFLYIACKLYILKTKKKEKQIIAKYMFKYKISAVVSFHTFEQRKQKHALNKKNQFAKF